MTARPILAVALSPALERYLWFDEFVTGGTNRPDRVVIRPGGKGLHVALAARALDARATPVGVLGGGTGHTIETLTRSLGVEGRWIRGTCKTRATVSIFARHLRPGAR